MTGVNLAGVRATRESAPLRPAPSVGLGELLNLGPKADRNAAIVALSLCHEWSNGRLADLFGVSIRRVQQIVGDFKTEILDGRAAPWARGQSRRSN